MNEKTIIKACEGIAIHSTLELGPQDEFDALCANYRRMADESAKVPGRIPGDSDV